MRIGAIIKWDTRCVTWPTSVSFIYLEGWNTPPLPRLCYIHRLEQTQLKISLNVSALASSYFQLFENRNWRNCPKIDNRLKSRLALASISVLFATPHHFEADGTKVRKKWNEKVGSRKPSTAISPLLFSFTSSSASLSSSFTRLLSDSYGSGERIEINFLKYLY